MSTVEELKKQIEQQKKLLSKKEAEYGSVSEKTKLKRELTNLRLRTTYYPIAKTISNLKEEGKKIGNKLGTEIQKIQKVQDEKKKQRLSIW